MGKTWKGGFTKCPFCKGEKFVAGPRGGLSQNFKCDNCGACFNNMGPFGVELLSKPELPELCEGGDL